MSRSTRSASSLRIGINDDSLGRVSARSRSIGQEVARMKARVRDKNGMFRVARVGPGWVVGVIEALSGSENPGHAFAVSHCRLHYIAYHKINDIEAESPSLALKCKCNRSIVLISSNKLTHTLDSVQTIVISHGKA